MAFALISCGNKKSVIHRAQLLNRHLNTANCTLWGEKQHVLIDGFHDDYEVLNQIATIHTIHNQNRFRVDLTSFNVLPCMSVNFDIPPSTSFETPKMIKPLWSTNTELKKYKRKRIPPKNIFKTGFQQLIEIQDTPLISVEGITPLQLNDVHVSPPPLVIASTDIIIRDYDNIVTNVEAVEPVETVELDREVEPVRVIEPVRAVKPIEAVKTIDKTAGDGMKCKRKNKSNLCKYCHMKNTNIKRHITSMHQNEDEVKEFMLLADNNPKKKQLLSQIRRDGNFVAFREKEYVLSREKAKFDPQFYIACSSCKIVIKKTSLRRHFQKNCPKSSGFISASRSIMKSSKAISEDIHDIAIDVMKNLVFPSFREGPLKEVIRFDRLILIYGNEMCLKYRAQHHYPMIRNRMLRLAKMLIKMKASNEKITDFKDILKPKHFDAIIQVINDFGNFNSNTGNYEKPSLPTEIGTSLKYTIKLYISECIKEGNMDEKKEAKNLLHLLQTALPAHVNKTAAESLLQQKRHKIPVLPSIDDIYKLNVYLLHGRIKHHKELEKNFDLHHWLQLGSFTLISIMVFNRRRPGEMQRALVSDLKYIQRVKEDAEFCKNLTEEEFSYVKDYMRLGIRGKLARGVPVLLHNDMYESIKLLLKYREQAGVLHDNPYIFAKPQNRLSEQKVVYSHLIATDLIRKFSVCCGAENPSTLRATILRKHVATISISLNMDSEELANFQNHMGHADKIHREYYRQPVVERDIVNVTRVLVRAMGGSFLPSETSSTAIPNTSNISRTTSCVDASNSNNIATTSSGCRSDAYLSPLRDSDSEDDSEYIPNDSTDDTDDGEMPSKRRRLIGMEGFATNIKRRWTKSEKEAVERIFAELSHLTPRRVRSQIQNQKKLFQKSVLLQQQEFS